MMTHAQDKTEDQSTGLPVLRTWGRVYWMVTAIFMAWVALLALLARFFA